MAKISNSTFVSIDGVINHMEAWHFDLISEEIGNITLEQIRASDAMLMGRKTYDAYAGAWPQRTGEYPDEINNIRKYVVSTTMEKAAWKNTVVLRKNVVEEVRSIKQRGGDILMHGFGPVANLLIKNGLLDELHLWVHPRFAGVGTVDDMLFSEGNNARLELTGTRVLDSGVVLLSYHVADSEPPGA
jgi:dihydrofolate reductase